MDRMLVGCLIGAVAILLVFGLLFGMCELQFVQDKKAASNRMVKIERFEDNGYPMYIWVDMTTKVQYLQINTLGFTVMLDADGKPLLYEEK